MEIIFSGWNPQWRAQFRAIQADLGGGLKKNRVSYLTIEHVGSTSIAHLVAKPMLDILIVVADADFNDSHRERLKENQRIMQYSMAKNEIVRKVLKKAGWTHAEVDEKEGREKKGYPEI
ncbi:hypothetical protein HO173_006580 [Letharia columbiana]|uniref:GrpB family protein n=1 Tax=Letharia columbiana TaxID=112416 RepID=A0A8H6FVB2_9LECA|nr:uncharacterized protein HO173_006580 [Letharia columbiana]KAF6235384.1 hypothetical protein HO173_006580 [Letharia columbiana]